MFNRDELEKLYAAAWKHFEAGDMTVHKLAPLAILFQFQTGVRIGELTAVRKLCKEIDTVHKSSHAARKTFISALIDGGVNINTIRELMGHRDERTTYNSYCYDYSTNDERAKLIENALL